MGEIPLISLDGTGKTDKFVALGDLTAVNAARFDRELNALACEALDGAGITIDMAAVRGFDTYGAWLLQRFRRDIEARGGSVTILHLPTRNKAVFAEMDSVNKSALPKHQTSIGGRLLESGIGETVRGIRNDLVAFAVMFGALIAATGRSLMRPQGFRMTSSVHQFDRVGWQAVPIMLMITFLIGAIIAQQGFFHFRRFGAELYVVDMVGFLVMREMGVLLVAIMVAGRTGSAYTAELGSMKMREEIDALKTMGFDPVEILILPRILILVIALPALAFIGSMAALFGAGVVATFHAGMSQELFIDRLREAITLDHFLVGLIKAPFIGAVIGVIACNEGLAVQGSAASLGTHTTHSVVKSIFMVIVLDGLFAMFFTAIRM